METRGFSDYDNDNVMLHLTQHEKSLSNFKSINTVSKSTFFSIWVFLSRTFTNHRTPGEGGGHFFNSSLPLPPTSQTLRHQPSDYCRELASAHRQQPDSNREPLVSERKSLTTKLRALSLFNFDALRCSAYWKAALKRGRQLFQSKRD